MHRLLLCLFIALPFLRPEPAQAVSENLRRYGFSEIGIYGDFNRKKYQTSWQDKSKPVELTIKVGWEAPRRSDPRIVTSDYDCKGILVRLRAFDMAGRPAGDINRSKRADATFPVEKGGAFIPPKPGTYRLKLEVLDERRQPIPMRSYDEERRLSKAKTLTHEILLEVRPEKDPLFLVQYSNWRMDKNDPNLFERSVDIYRYNRYIYNPKFRVPVGGQIPMQPQRSFKLELSVVPPFPVANLNKVSWISTSNPVVMDRRWTQISARQYFRYDPTRDMPRNADLFTVKVKVLP